MKVLIEFIPGPSQVANYLKERGHFSVSVRCWLTDRPEGRGHFFTPCGAE